MEIEEMGLYGLQQAVYQIIEKGFMEDPETGEIIFLGEDLDKLNDALENKINNIIGYIKYCDSKTESLKKREEEIKNLKKYYNKKSESLTKFLKYYLENNNKENGIETKDYKVSFRKSTKGIVTDEKKLLEWIKEDEEREKTYLKFTDPEIANDLIKKFVSSGNEVPGFELKENKNIQIK